VQLLTPPDTAAGQHVTVEGWAYALSSDARDQDAERYALMSSGRIADFTADSLMPSTGDPSELMALGPFASIADGDSIVVDFALVGGSEPDVIGEHAYQAQVMRDEGFPMAGVPALSTLLSAGAGADGVHLRWFAQSDPGSSVLVERAEAGAPDDWRALGEFAPEPSGLVAVADRDVRPGGRYGYRMTVRSGGTEVTTPAVWIGVPATAEFALRGVSPNPLTTFGGVVTCSLPVTASARLECFDLLGRREASLELPSASAGEHAVPLAGLGGLRAGVHLLRLTQGSRSATSRVVVVR
jgi:hypothetical protein